MTILIAGGAGYIGSHVVLALLSSRNFRKTKFVIMDNLSMGHLEIVKVLQDCAVDLGQPEVVFEKADLLDSAALDLLFERHKPDVVLHLAAKISVAESVTHPALYFSNNVTGSQNLLLAMKNHDCKKIVFSSTASVYGNIDSVCRQIQS